MSYSVIVIYKEYNDDVERCFGSIMGNYNPDMLEVLTSDAPNKSRARNDLCKKAKGEILVFLDSDAKVTEHSFSELLKPFADPKVAVVGGCNILRQDASRMEVLSDKILSFPLATFKSAARYKVSGRIRDADESELSTCLLAMRKKVFFEAGMFPENVIPCEENVLLNNVQKLGYRMLYNPLAIVYHNRDELFIPYAKKMFSYAKGRGKMMRLGKGGLKMIPRPSVDILFLGVGLVTHYLSYVSGLIWGYVEG